MVFWVCFHAENMFLPFSWAGLYATYAETAKNITYQQPVFDLFIIIFCVRAKVNAALSHPFWEGVSVHEVSLRSIEYTAAYPTNYTLLKKKEKKNKQTYLLFLACCLLFFYVLCFCFKDFILHRLKLLSARNKNTP